jgi:NTP pyrophosphatase (non-canonical NTP hydrolase)
MTFEEFQTRATNIPASMRNNLDRVNLPIRGLQQEAGKIGSLLARASRSGRFESAPDERSEVRDRLGDMLWYIALLCGETEIPMQKVPTHDIARLGERFERLDPEQR